MKRFLIVFLVCLMPSLLFAAPGFGGPMYMPFSPFFPKEAGPYVTSEILTIESEMASKKVGDFDVTDVVGLRERLSVAAQKDEYVNRMSLHSMMLPGLGELETGDTTNGLVFLGADLATIAGTLTLAYFLLPSDLRFDRLDYLGDSMQTINDRWMAHTLPDYLPAMAALAGGAIIDITLRQWSSRVARRDATASVNAENVKFTPKLGLGFMGFDVAY